jgi:hypothetical protein
LIWEKNENYIIEAYKRCTWRRIIWPPTIISYISLMGDIGVVPPLVTAVKNWQYF